MFELAYCNQTKHYWVINNETQEATPFEDIKLSFKDVWETLEECDGCCLDNEDDVSRILQTILNKVTNKCPEEKP